MEKLELMSKLFSEDTLNMMERFKDLCDPERRLNPSKLLPTGRGCLEIRQPALTSGSAVY
jgi:glycolate oxidase